MRGLASFWQSTKRVISSSGFIDSERFSTTCGIPQGCVLSAALTNAQAHEWDICVEQALTNDVSGPEPNATARENTPATTTLTTPPPLPQESFVCRNICMDDRLVWARQAMPLQTAWCASLAWEQESSWRLKLSKCELLTCGATDPAHPDLQFMCEDDVVKAVPRTKSLGHDVLSVYACSGTLQQDRTRRYTERNEWPYLGPIPVSSKPVTVKHCDLLDSAIKTAMGVWKRTTSWLALSALAHNPTRLHARSIAITGHVLAVHRAMQPGHLSCSFYWPLAKCARGPVGVLAKYIELIGCDMNMLLA
eukprot:5886300-Amphidinium_carterae.1